MKVMNKNVLGLCKIGDLTICDKFDLDGDSFVVDLGGFDGGFSKYILDKYNCRVDAYEPSKDIFRLTHPKLKFTNKAVWNGKKVKFLQTKGLDSSIKRGEGEWVETVDILDITKEPIDLMKVNIEGAEIEVLNRADLSNVRQLLVEFHVWCMDIFKPKLTRKAINDTVDKIMSYGYEQIKLREDGAGYYFYKKREKNERNK